MVLTLGNIRGKLWCNLLFCEIFLSLSLFLENMKIWMGEIKSFISCAGIHLPHPGINLVKWNNNLLTGGPQILRWNINWENLMSWVSSQQLSVGRFRDFQLLVREGHKNFIVCILNRPPPRNLRWLEHKILEGASFPLSTDISTSGF